MLVDCLGVPVARLTRDELYAWFFQVARARDTRTLYFANAHSLNLACADAAFSEALHRADLVLNDGIGLDIYAKLAGTKFHENFNGTDLLPALFAQASTDRPLRVFLYGAAPGRAARAAENIEARYPGVRIVGVMHGYERDGAVEMINAADADLVLVAMGNPLQEKWIDEHRSQLRAGVVAGVGALLDFLSGEMPRAPMALRAMRCEWMYRLFLEPKRMFRRYVVGNPVFVARALMHTLALRF
jgi:exopolysaccharide biosynthesis WecB/TagA/CpsF family protein